MPDDGFGLGVPKLHRALTGTLRSLSAEALRGRASRECAKDDQRRVALEASDIYNQTFPLYINFDVIFSQTEFTTAVQRKLGLPLSCLRNHIGEPIAANGKSPRLRVDRWGKHIAAASGVKGDHFRTTHDTMVTFTIGCLKDAGIVSRGGGYGSLKGIFSKCIDQSNIRPEDKRKINGILPDGSANGYGVPQIIGFHKTKLHDFETLLEFKGLSTQSESVEDRASRIDRDIEEAAADLDSRYPGSTVLEEKRKYGKDGKYLALVTGSLGNLSSDFSTIVEFIASIQTVRALQWQITGKEQLFSMYRRFLVSTFGLFASRLWARHILARFRDAVAVTASSNLPHFPNPDREIIRDFHLGNSRARRAQRFGPHRA